MIGERVKVERYGSVVNSRFVVIFTLPRLEVIEFSFFLYCTVHPVSAWAYWTVLPVIRLRTILPSMEGYSSSLLILIFSWGNQQTY